MTYFYVICLYLKLKLRNANNSIRNSFKKKYKISNHRMKNILISLDFIISKINTYNNGFVVQVFNDSSHVNHNSL